MQADTEQNIKPVHALAMHGKPKYDADFMHFDYVNSNAPKCGVLRTAITRTFEHTDIVCDQGDYICCHAYRPWWPVE